jgi:undecaprenyl-diphosphatase
LFCSARIVEQKDVPMDMAILYGIQSCLGCPFLDTVMPYVTMLGEHGAVWLVIGIGLMISKKYRMWGAVMLVAMASAYLIGEELVKPLVARPRPFDIDTAYRLLIQAPSGYSMPSGHTSASFAAATVLLFAPLKRRWKAGAFVLAALIAFSRLYLFVHNPSDVLAGAVLGGICALCAVGVMRAVSKHRNS